MHSTSTSVLAEHCSQNPWPQSRQVWRAPPISPPTDAPQRLQLLASVMKTGATRYSLFLDSLVTSAGRSPRTFCRSVESSSSLAFWCLRFVSRLPSARLYSDMRSCVAPRRCVVSSSSSEAGGA